MTGGNRRVMDEAVLGFEVLRCTTCGAALDGDPDDDATGDAGMPICGECERRRDFFSLDVADGALDDDLESDR